MDNRDLRYKFSGMIFTIVLVLMMCLSDDGNSFINNLRNHNSISDSIGGIVAVAALLFASEAVGYIIYSIFFFSWNRYGGLLNVRGGFSREWDKLDINLKERLLAFIENEAGEPKKTKPFHRYTPDVFFSYYFHSVTPKSVHDWSQRRYENFFAQMSALSALILGTMTSTFLLMCYHCGWSFANTIASIFIVVLSIVLFINGYQAKLEGRQMVELWLYSISDDDIKNALERFLS